MEIVLTQTFPSGDAIIVSGPLKTKIQFAFFAAFTDFSILFLTFLRSGKILLNSPSCGVIILFLSKIKNNSFGFLANEVIASASITTLLTNLDISLVLSMVS